MVFPALSLAWAGQGPLGFLGDRERGRLSEPDGATAGGERPGRFRAHGERAARGAAWRRFRGAFSQAPSRRESLTHVTRPVDSARPRRRGHVGHI